MFFFFGKKFRAPSPLAGVVWVGVGGARGGGAPVAMGSRALEEHGLGEAAGGSGKRRAGERAVTVYCNAEEYGGTGSHYSLDASGCKSLDDVAAAVRRGFALPAARTVEVVAPVTGEPVPLDALHAPSEGLRLVLRIDGTLANFRMERVRSNLPVKGFLDDLAACQVRLPACCAREPRPAPLCVPPPAHARGERVLDPHAPCPRRAFGRCRVLGEQVVGGSRECGGG